jgi:KUP system potassium uptake protein
MAVWRIGRRILLEYTKDHSAPLDRFLDTLDDRHVVRVPGTGVFMSSVPTDVPLILEHHIQRIGVLHEHVVLLTIVFDHVPYVPRAEHFTVEPLAKGFTRIIAHYGYMDATDVPAMLRDAKAGHALTCDLHDATFYLGRETFLATSKGRLGSLREGLFGFLSRNSISATSYFAIPPEQVVELGTQIDL